MKFIKVVLASAIAALVLGIGVSTASAQLLGGDSLCTSLTTPPTCVDSLSDAGVLVFTGHANLSTTIPAPPATGVGGTYSFQGGCLASAIISDGDIDVNIPPGVEDPQTGSCSSISSTGSFNNTVCGTGNATGDATVTTTDGKVKVHYTIVFVAGVGVLVVDSASSTDENGNPDDGFGAGAGVVLLSNITSTPPTIPGDECTGPTNGFDITGAAAVALLETDPTA